MSAASGPRPSDRFIPWYIVLFFVVQAAGFAWFYHIATSTYTGLVTESAYEKGLQYNKVIAEAQAQEKLGWTSEIVRQGNRLQVSVRDHGGKPVSGAHVYLWLVRPVQAGMDQHLEMTESAPGTYVAVLSLPEKGLWEARVEVQQQGNRYQTSKRMEF